MTLKRGHDLPSRVRKPGDVPVVSSSGITGFHNEAKAQAPGVVTGRYGTLGEVFYLEKDYWPLNTSLYVVDFKDSDPRFCAYFLKNVLKSYKSDKAAVPGVDRNVLHALDVDAPDRSTQDSIAEVLSAYDDLIENNNRRIELLEQSARELYKEWFVRFQFPGHEHIAIVDGVPDGWDAIPASMACDVNPKVSVEKGKELVHVPMAALSESSMILDSSKFELRTKHTSVRFQNGDTLFARITPCLENGKTGYVNFIQKGHVACGSTEFVVLRGCKVSNEFTYLLARDETFRANAAKSMTGSSGRQRVQPSCFEKYVVAIPPKGLQLQFDEVVRPCFSQINVLAEQNTGLARARDLLLPSLMSGEIPV